MIGFYKKKTTRLILSLFIMIVVLLVFFTPEAGALAVKSGNATNYSYTLNSDGEWVQTQDAYLSGEILFLDNPLNNPEDLYLKENTLYIADSKNSRVVCYDLKTGETGIIGEGILSLPTGVFVRDNGEIYVADMALLKVLVFDSSNNLLREYVRPETITFGKNAQFNPKKVAVDSAGIISIVSEGAFDGIVQLSDDNTFLGYFGYNSVPMSFLELVQDKIFTDKQKEQLFKKTPLTFSNLTQDEMGVIYTLTNGPSSGTLKKHNISGVNILPDDVPCESNFADISVGPDGQIFAITESGVIYEYDNEGALLFSFGGQALGSERSGLLTLASGIAVDDSHNIFVLDKEKGLVHTYHPTAFAANMHRSIRLYNSGEYEKSREEMLSLLKFSGNVRIVYNYLGKNELQLRRYDDAAVYFENAGNRSGYSEAFWEIRNNKVSVILPYIILAIAVLLIAFASFKLVRRKVPVKEKLAGIEKKSVKSDLAFAFNFFKHPFDSFYEVKKARAGSALSATILYIIAFLVFAADTLLRAFTVSNVNTENTSLLYVTILFIAPIALFVIASYMVSEINDGEGRFKKLYIGFGYSLIPLICFLPLITLITHVITLNEMFIVSFGSLFIYTWVAVLVVLCIKEIHNYDFKAVFLNIVLTLFLLIVIIFILSIIGMFWNKILEIVDSVVREVKYRVGK